MIKSKDKFSIVSDLDKSYKTDLENLLFFHPDQGKVASGIIASIDIFGLPKIIIVNDIIKVKVGEIEDVQNIFLLDNQEKSPVLAGVMIFFRENDSTITLLHLAVNDNYSLSSLNQDSLAFTLIDKLKEIAKIIKGVDRIKIIYSKKNIRLVNV